MDGSRKCESVLFQREPVWAELSEVLTGWVASDPLLADYISDGDDLGDEIEILEPETVDPLTFDWDNHQRRIRAFLVSTIRSYAFEMKHVIFTGDKKETKKSIKKTNWRKSIDKTHNELVELVAHSKEIHKEIKLNRKRKVVKDLNKIVTQLYSEMDEEIQCLRDELYPVGDKLVAKWLKEKRHTRRRESGEDKKEMERFFCVAVEREVERMVTRRLKRSQKMRRIEEMEPKAREARLACILQLRRKKEKMRKYGKAGTKKYLAVTLYCKWRRVKRTTTLRNVKKLNRICRDCKEKERTWWREGDGRKQAGELTLEDAKKFQCQLFRSGKMDILVDYLAILLKKPGIRTITLAD